MQYNINLDKDMEKEEIVKAQENAHIKYDQQIFKIFKQWADGRNRPLSSSFVDLRYRKGKIYPFLV